jgi:hypothetical protein
MKERVAFESTFDAERGGPAGHSTVGRGMLMIAYHFPPSAAVGGRRMANFASALRSLGWNVRALTIPDAAIEQIDRSRLGSVAGVSITVAPVWPTFASVLTAALKRRHTTSASPAPRRAPQPPGSGRATSEPLGQRVRRYVMSFALLPDGTRGWCVPAVAQAVRMIRRYRLDWFMTSCPPYSVHLIGLGVRQLTSARWIADFRDPWMTTGSKRLYPTCAASWTIESWLERRVIERADLVVFNVERLRNAYRDRYSHVPPDKFVFIPNAIATSGQPGEAPPKFDRFTICYTGSLYVGRSPEPVFRAVSRLIQSGSVARDAIRILLVGQCDSIDGTPTETVIRNSGLESNVELRNYVPYGEAFDLVRRSHLALLLAPNLPYQIPAKVYDYLGAGTRILAIAEDGGTADMLNGTRAGSAFSSEDVDGIAAFILDELGATSSPACAPMSLARYDVNRITKDLMDHLSRVSQC